jgi:hypothetical protein
MHVRYSIRRHIAASSKDPQRCSLSHCSEEHEDFTLFQKYLGEVLLRRRLHWNDMASSVISNLDTAVWKVNQRATHSEWPYSLKGVFSPYLPGLSPKFDRLNSRRPLERLRHPRHALLRREDRTSHIGKQRWSPEYSDLLYIKVQKMGMSFRVSHFRRLFSLAYKTGLGR